MISLRHIQMQSICRGLPKMVLKGLISLHLMVAPDKVQMVASFALLGFSIAKQVLPVSFQLEMKEWYSSSESQQLCGMNNWLNPFMFLPHQEMRYLFSLLEDPTWSSIKIRLTHEARELLQNVVAILVTSGLQCHDPQKLLLAMILWTLRGLGENYGNQDTYCEYIYHSDLCKIASKFEQSFQLDLKAWILALRTYGQEPDKLVFRFLLKNTWTLWVDTILFQEMVTGFTGTIDNHLPKKQDLSRAPYTSNRYSSIQSLLHSPLPCHPGLFRLK